MVVVGISDVVSDDNRATAPTAQECLGIYDFDIGVFAGHFPDLILNWSHILFGLPDADKAIRFRPDREAVRRGELLHRTGHYDQDPNPLRA